MKYANKNINTLLSNVTSTISSKLVHYRRNLDMLLYLAGKPYNEVVFQRKKTTNFSKKFEN